MKQQPQPGTRVRFTGEFLRNSGQIKGGEGQSRWTVVECTCGLCMVGTYVAVNQPSHDDPSQQRHINFFNLEKCR